MIEGLAFLVAALCVAVAALALRLPGSACVRRPRRDCDCVYCRAQFGRL